jgi:hypothetical protein
VRTVTVGQDKDVGGSRPPVELLLWHEPSSDLYSGLPLELVECRTFIWITDEQQPGVR